MTAAVRFVSGAVVTLRLRLVPLSADDAHELVQIRGDLEAMQFWYGPCDSSPAATAAIVQLLLSDVAAGNALYWTLRTRTDGTFVGLCDLSEIVAGDFRLALHQGQPS